MAQPRAVIHVVMAKALTDEFLKEIRLFIGAFGTAESRNGRTAMGVLEPLEATGGKVERLVPLRLAEEFVPVAGINVEALGRCILAPDERLGEAVRVVDIVVAKAPLDTQPPLVCRAVDALDILDLAVLDPERHLTADTAERADALHLVVVIGAVALLLVIHNRGGHQRAGGASLHAFAAGDTGALAHRVVEIEDRIGIVAAPGHADHVIDLHIAAGADAQVALDAGIKVDAHGHVTVIQKRDSVALQFGKAAMGHAVGVGHVPQMAGGIMRGVAFGLIGEQHLDHHLARGFGAVRIGRDDHAFAGLADTGGHERALALDFDHAGAAVAIGTIAGSGLVAEMRDYQAATIGDLPDRQTGFGLDLLSIECDLDRLRHARASLSVAILDHARAFPSPPIPTPHRIFTPRWRRMFRIGVRRGGSGPGNIFPSRTFNPVACGANVARRAGRRRFGGTHSGTARAG